jgi:hypothetical protein
MSAQIIQFAPRTRPAPLPAIEASRTPFKRIS